MQEPTPHGRSDLPAPAPKGVHPELIPLIQFFSIQLAQLADGGFFVAVSATLSEGDGDLSAIEIAGQRVGCFDEALRLIADTAAPATRAIQ